MTQNLQNTIKIKLYKKMNLILYIFYRHVYNCMFCLLYIYCLNKVYGNGKLKVDCKEKCRNENYNL